MLLNNRANIYWAGIPKWEKANCTVRTHTYSNLNLTSLNLHQNNSLANFVEIVS